MVFPKLTKTWVFPSPHEKEITTDLVYEIFYDRVLVFLIFSFFIGFISNQLLDGNLLSGFLLTGIFFFLIFLIFFPLFIKPWDLVLSNKRLILRHRYWFSGRLATVTSVFLTQLESEKVSPRIKVTSLLLGFFILQSFSIVLIDFGLTLSLPLPLFVSLLLFLGSIFGFTGNFQTEVKAVTSQIFSPFLDYALVFGLISLVIAVALIIFSLPYKKEMRLNTVGGHVIKLNAGIDPVLSNLVFSVSRKHIILPKRVSHFKWDMPLLDDEEIRSYGRVGFIDRRAQILGILSLFLVFQSIDSFYSVFIAFTLSNIIIFLVNSVNLVLIIFSILFSKRYSRIIATNHRLLFQDERSRISGIWGKRIYQYSDLQKKHLQSYKVERFTGITAGSIITGILLVIFSLFMFSTTRSIPLLFFLFIITIVYLILSYKAFTRLEFKALSGFSHVLDYKFPLLIEWFGHKIEDMDRIYNLIFANILTEESIVNLCNNIRDITEPIIDINKFHSEMITEAHLIGKNETIMKSWKDMRSRPYYNTSLVTAGILSVITMGWLYPLVTDNYKLLYLIVSLSTITFLLFRMSIQFYYTLILTTDRLIFVEKILPKSLAKVFGVLPKWSLHEISRDQLQGSEFKYLIPTFAIKSFILSIIGLIIMVLMLIMKKSITSFYPPAEGLFSLVGAEISIIILFYCVIALYSVVPRYALRVFSKFDSIYIPFFKNITSYSKIISEEQFTSY